LHFVIFLFPLPVSRACAVQMPTYVLAAKVCPAGTEVSEEGVEG
jgi:hypothetical protein